jgi:hypothetical protein
MNSTLKPKCYAPAIFQTIKIKIKIVGLRIWILKKKSLKKKVEFNTRIFSPRFS